MRCDRRARARQGPSWSCNAVSLGGAHCIGRAALAGVMHDTWTAPSGMSAAAGADARAAAAASAALSAVKRSAPPGAPPTSASPRPTTSSTYAVPASPAAGRLVVIG